MTPPYTYYTPIPIPPPSLYLFYLFHTLLYLPTIFYLYLLLPTVTTTYTLPRCTHHRLPYMVLMRTCCHTPALPPAPFLMHLLVHAPLLHSSCPHISLPYVCTFPHVWCCTPSMPFSSSYVLHGSRAALFFSSISSSSYFFSCFFYHLYHLLYLPSSYIPFVYLPYT